MPPLSPSSSTRGSVLDDLPSLKRECNELSPSICLRRSRRLAEKAVHAKSIADGLLEAVPGKSVQKSLKERLTGYTPQRKSRHVNKYPQAPSRVQPVRKVKLSRVCSTLADPVKRETSEAPSVRSIQTTSTECLSTIKSSESPPDHEMTSPSSSQEPSVPPSVQTRSPTQSVISELDLGPSMTTIEQQIENSLLSDTGTVVPAESVDPVNWPTSLGLHAQPTSVTTIPSLSTIDLLNKPLEAEELQANICASATMSRSRSRSESTRPRDRRSHRRRQNPMPPRNAPTTAMPRSPTHTTTRTEDLSSNVVSSGSASFTNENPLSALERRRDTFHTASAVSAALNAASTAINAARQWHPHSHAEDLESQALSSGSISFSNPNPLTDRPRRVDQIHSAAPAANLLPFLPYRSTLRDASGSSQHPNTQFFVQKKTESIQYGYGYGGYHTKGFPGHPSHFWIAGDAEGDEESETLLQQQDSPPPNQRLVIHNSMNLTPKDHRDIHRRKALLARFEHTLDLFPGIEIENEVDL